MPRQRALERSKEPAVPREQVAPKSGDLVVTKAFDEGDTVRFERPSPFGTSVWRKKKSELDAADQKIIDEQQKSKK